MKNIIAFDFPEARHTDIYCWLEQLGVDFYPVAQGQFDWRPPPGARLLVTAQAYSATHINILIEAQKQGVKTLLLADGILEFRNTYRNPANTPGSMFMPLVADKMACIGRAQAARIESWGNPGRCEVVGLPMMDRVKRPPPPRPPSQKPFRLLAATARTPWFDDQQRELVLKSLASLRDAAAQIDGMEIWWRLAPQAAESLGVVNHVPRFQDQKMDACIDHVDAVISTPSTLLLYPMLQGKPAVTLDFTRSPAYMQTAWTITAAEHILPTLREIKNPPGDKMWFQRQTLDDNLEWSGSATERLGALMAKMLGDTGSSRPPPPPPAAVNSTPQNAPELSRFFQSSESPECTNRTQAQYQLLQGKTKSELGQQLRENSALRDYIKDLLAGKDWLEQQYNNWKTEAARLSALLRKNEPHRRPSPSIVFHQTLPPPDAPAPKTPPLPDTKPLVSIVTPYYQTGKIFHETAESVFKQTLRDWEWLIINDGSTEPEALATLDCYRKKDKRITIIDHAENKGLSAARNTGARAATTEYIMFLDSDDLLEPTCLEKLYWKLATHPELAFADAYCTGFGTQRYVWEKGFSNGAAFLAENFATINAMVRRAVCLETGGFDETRRGGLEDWDFWLKCADKGHWGATVTEPLTRYRRRENHGGQWDNLNKKGIAAFKADMPKKYPRLTTASFPQPRHEWHQPFQPVNMEIPECLPTPGAGKPTLLFLLPHMAMGGADKWNLDIIGELVTHHGWHVCIAATNTGSHPWLSQFQKFTDDIHILSNFLTLPDYPRYLLHLINSRTPKIVCISNSRVAYSLLPALHACFPGIPFVDYVHMEEEHWRSGGYAMDSVRLSPILSATGVSSNHLKNWMLARGGREGGIRRIYTNIDTQKWSPSADNKTPSPNKWNIPKNTPVILHACRLAPQKQPDVFAKTVNQFLRAGNKATFIIAGDGPQSAIISQLQSENPRHVKWLGAVPAETIKELMAISDIFFLPSQMEGIALSFYEAMSMGVVPVGADVGGQRELVTEDCGVLIKRSGDEAAQYAQILANLLANPGTLNKMKAACRARVTGHFELRQMTASMLELFAQATQRAPETRLSALPSGLVETFTTEIIEQIRLENLAEGLCAERERGEPDFKQQFRNSKLSPRLSKTKRGILRFLMRHL